MQMLRNLIRPSLHPYRRSILCALLLVVCGSAAHAFPVGLTYRDIKLASAASRRSDHKPLLHVTIWYPATAGTIEQEIDIDPPGGALLIGGRFGKNATPQAGLHPVIMLSPGFGGSAEDLSWLGGGLAAQGFIVIGVDHPGNNPRDKTLVGGTAWWERPRDLIAAIHAVRADATLGSHLDMNHVGAAGFSMGGMTALALGGAVIDPGHFDDFCATKPADKVCDTAPETPNAPHVTQRQGIHILGLDEAAAHAADGTAFPSQRAILAIAPPVQMLNPDSLARINAATVLIVGTRDPLVPGPQEAGLASQLIKGAKLISVPDAAHYSFIGTCTPKGRKVLVFCGMAPEQAHAHSIALEQAIKLFKGMVATGRS